MKKRVLFLLSTVLVLSLLIPTFVFGDCLTDIETSPYKVEIEKLVEEGIIFGYPDKTFKPEGTISREELVSILVKALKLEEDKDAGSNFIDVKSTWSEGIVGAVYNKGIMIGKSKTEFGPKDNITKEEMAVLLLRAFGLEEVSKELKLETEFEDNEVLGLWSKYSVSLAFKLGLFNATTNKDGTMSFNPKLLVDRQTVAKLVYELISNEKVYKDRVNTLKLESTGENKDVNDETNKNEANNEKRTYDSIVAKYTNQLSLLESKYSGILDSLMSQAKAEYEQNKDNQDFSVTALYKKYEAIAREYEVQADSEVSSVLSQLSSELTQYGYDTSIVGELQQQYEAKKEAIEVQI